MKIPLSVYVVKHPNFDKGIEYAEEIYNEIYRNFEDEVSIKSSVPVYYSRSKLSNENQLIINFDDSERIAIVILVDSNMVLDNDSNWDKYIKYLYDKSTLNGNIRLFPIAIKEPVMKKYKNTISKLNFIRAFEKEESNKMLYILLNLKHELCRMLFDIERVDEANINTDKPVKLFLSHAKRDGVLITTSVRNFINNDTGINDFFDAVDIEFGSDFSEKIESSISESNLLIAFHSDGYSKSEWCKKEVLLAKEKDIPILIVDCLKYGEDRSFPYLGNARSICVNKENINMNYKIISAALSEILKRESYKKLVLQVAKKAEIDISESNIKSNAPELISLVDEENMIVYPEPPVGKFELEMLKSKLPNIKILTPIMLFSQSKEYNFENIKIALSISESETGYKYGITNAHCEAVSLELARYILQLGGKLLYGGDINYSINTNFTKSLIYILETYSKEYSVQSKLINYEAGYLVDNISVDKMLEYDDYVEFINLDHRNIYVKTDIDEELKIKVEKALDLSDMRKRMTEDLDVRVVLGGKYKGFSGKYPGILEEVLLAIENKKPVYLMGAFGGITSEIVKFIMNEDNIIKNGDLENIAREEALFSIFNKLVPDDKIDYVKVKSKLEVLEIADLNNGLSIEENKVLFKSKNVEEIIILILKGINNLIEEGKLKNTTTI